MCEQGATQSRELDGLLKWAAGEGITDATPLPSNPSCLGHTLGVSHFPTAGGRGLQAQRPLKRGDLILTVPSPALLTSNRILATDQPLSILLQRHPSLVPSQVLSICLLRELSKGKTSKWHPYLATVPRRYHLLASFTDVETRALQFNDAVYAAEKSRNAVLSQWREAVPVLEELGMMRKYRSYEAWIWAHSTVSSRTMHIPWDKAGCLCPVGDLFNYAAPDDTDLNEKDGVYSEESGEYCFYARRDYEKGEQVMLSYGTYTNLELLEHYGFVLADNPNERIFIPLEGTMEALTWPRDSMFIDGKGRPSFALAAMLRRWAAMPEERKAIGRVACGGGTVSVANEIRVLNWLVERCSAVLSGFESCLEDDEQALLRDGEEDEAERLNLAVRLRIGHKKALANCVAFCRESLGNLQG